MSKPDGGLKDALGLDQAASDLEGARASVAENRPGTGEATAETADPDAAQLALFAGQSVFGTIRQPGGDEIRPSGPGRPRGSRNRSTKDLVKLITATGKHPLIAMAEIVATPIDVLAATLGCKKLEAAEYHRKVMSDLAPYVGQKMPTAVQIEGANAGMLVINLGGALGEAVKGLDMKLIEGEAEGQQYQALSDDDDAPSHGEPSHGEGK